MFSRAFRSKKISLGRFQSLLKRSETRQSITGGRTRNDEHKSGNEIPKFLLRSFTSGAVIAGSCLGFSYWYSPSVHKNSFLSFAESRTDAILASNDDHVPTQKKQKFLFGDSYRRRIFFNYEKRIRLQSPPEKVFEYFASLQTPGGEALMTPADLMRAIVPVFPPSESDRIREGFLKGERRPGELHCAPSQFFMLFDTNGDGLISYPEYIFFVTLLSIPESSFSVAFKMFDLDDNGEIDREEFEKVMNLMRTQNRQVASQRDGRRIRLKVAESAENGGILEYFFGKDGKTSLHHGRFVQFLRDLHDEILRLEFAHYDYRSCGTISAKDFAMSLVASADINHINKLLDRVDEISNNQELRDIRIAFQEFRNFAELRKKLQPFSLAIFSYGKLNGMLTRKDFQRAASRVCGISITDNLVDIVFHVFDANRDGNLSSDEFVRVVQRREDEYLLPREAGFRGLVSCCANCAKDRSSAKLLF
ncbi:hypothetical protein K2173_021168 [Erythroxylum novogranatense]|uniref:EF-hand domain-containing protein n=1 Tax=Erythroxylum novogranatense TaxID=1862640 RepID=A0AAV8TQW2_9ROSI|nr:hypothetical protein K2173_021168 [Erythroxylum novogranatense]